MKADAAGFEDGTYKEPWCKQFLAAALKHMCFSAHMTRSCLQRFGQKPMGVLGKASETLFF